SKIAIAWFWGQQYVIEVMPIWHPRRLRDAKTPGHSLPRHRGDEPALRPRPARLRRPGRAGLPRVAQEGGGVPPREDRATPLLVRPEPGHVRPLGGDFPGLLDGGGVATGPRGPLPDGLGRGGRPHLLQPGGPPLHPRHHPGWGWDLLIAAA